MNGQAYYTIKSLLMLPAGWNSGGAYSRNKWVADVARTQDISPRQLCRDLAEVTNDDEGTICLVLTLFRRGNLWNYWKDLIIRREV